MKIDRWPSLSSTLIMKDQHTTRRVKILWCTRTVLNNPWINRQINKYIKEINTDNHIYRSEEVISVTMQMITNSAIFY